MSYDVAKYACVISCDFAATTRTALKGRSRPKAVARSAPWLWVLCPLRDLKLKRQAWAQLVEKGKRAWTRYPSLGML
jgi:hypothetical protein